VMEYAEHGSLYNVVHEPKTPLSLQQRRHIIEGMLAGVSYLHGRKVAHRDIKSPNVLITQHWEAKITDVGESVVKKESVATSLNYTRRGSPLWMAPEVLEGRPHNVFKADIYSTAIVLHEIMSSQVPFAALPRRGLEHLKEAVCGGSRPSLESLQSSVFERTVPCLQQAWHHDPEQRPSAADLASQTRACLPE